MSTSPIPDMSTKPPDIVRYAFAPVCDHDHVTGFGKETLTIQELDVLTACSECGRPARYATIQRVAEATWEPGWIFGNKEQICTYGWHQFGQYDRKYDCKWTRAVRVRAIKPLPEGWDS